MCLHTFAVCGFYKMTFERYEDVPQMIAAKIIEAHKADLADDED